MSLLDRLSDHQAWNAFFDYKVQCGNLSRSEEAEMLDFILAERYLDITRHLDEHFLMPRKRFMSKIGSDRKRVVYTFSYEENLVLKLLSYLLLRQYDGLFAPNLYSFRAHHGVKEAVVHFRHTPQLCRCYVFKMDIHDYFNSVDVSMLLPALGKAMADDVETMDFIVRLLRNPKVELPDGSVVDEAQKGIMAGVPISAFLANLYLADMDWRFYRAGVEYARYSDDIICFSDSEEHSRLAEQTIMEYLQKYHLEVNPKKVTRGKPGEMWDFLGFSFNGGIIDISPISLRKLKGKMRRKAHSLLRWQKRKGAEPDKAVKAFIRIFNRKFFDDVEYAHDLSWSRWFFPVINTSASLQVLDGYMQECCRYIMTGAHTKSRFRCRYASLKELGYKCLVNEYYKFKKG